MNAALALMLALPLEDGRTWGEAALSWQVEDAKAVLNLEGPRLHFLTRPRGGSKTTDLGGMCLAALLEQLAAGTHAYAFAADRDQAALLVDAIFGFKARAGISDADLRVDNYKVLAPKRGSRLDVMAADAASAWGLRGDLFIVDEFAQWQTTPGPRRLWEAIWSAVPKRNARLAILTTSGDPAHPSRRVLDSALGSEMWHVHEVPGPVPWVTEAHLEEQRRTLPESQFRRLHLNQWVAAEDRLVDPSDLAACTTLDGPQEFRPGRQYVAGVDIGLKRDRTVVSVCHREDGTVVLDRMLVWEGTKSDPVRLELVEAACFEVWREFRCRFVMDPYQAVQMAQRLRSAGVGVKEYPFSQQSIGRIAVTLFRLLRDHRVALPDDPELRFELANVRLRETSPGVLRMDHDPDKHDDRAIALALPAFELSKRPERRGYAVTAAGDVL